MKKIIVAVLIITVIVIISLFAKSAYVSNARLKVITSFYPMYIAVSNITDNVPGVSVSNLTNDTTGCVHDYVLSPKELVKVAESDVFVINGSGMEAFLDKVIKETPQIYILDSSEGVSCEYIIHEGNAECDPHTYLNIDNYIKQIENITRGFCEKDPEYKKLYVDNSNKYIKALNELKEYGKNKFQSMDIKVISQSNSFKYFAETFDIEVLAVVEKEEGQAPSIQELAEIISVCKKANVKVLVEDRDVLSSTTASIIKEASLTSCEFDKAILGSYDLNIYISTMKKNIDNIVKVVENAKV